MPTPTSKLGWIGTGRMGFEMAARLAKGGCDIAVWNRTRSKAEPLGKYGAKIVDGLGELASRDIVFCMVSTWDDVKSVMQQLLAGSQKPKMVVECSSISLEGSAELRQMLKQGNGAIVNCSSIGGLVAGAKRGTYQASKHGVLGLTKSAPLDYAARGIRINAVCPGIIHIGMLDKMMATQADALNAMLKDVPIGRLGRPEEIASAVLWLCSSAASFMVGHALAVDGGYTIR